MGLAPQTKKKYSPITYDRNIDFYLIHLTYLPNKILLTTIFALYPLLRVYVMYKSRAVWLMGEYDNEAEGNDDDYEFAMTVKYVKMLFHTVFATQH